MGSYAPSMPTTKVYEYKGCSTCRKALKWLEAQGIEYKAVPIRETPPNKTELRRVLKASEGNIRKLFNTSGGDYKKLNLKENLSQPHRKSASVPASTKLPRWPMTSDSPKSNSQKRPPKPKSSVSKSARIKRRR